MMDFLRIVNDDNSLNIGARQLSGIIPRIYEFADEDIQISSLHAAKDEVRSRLMPQHIMLVKKLIEAQSRKQIV